MKIQFPKNIQQIGESPFDKKVYLEDYVATFLEQLKKRDKGSGRTVLLYGRKEQDETQTCYFVYGAVLQDEPGDFRQGETSFPDYQMLGAAYICREGEETERRLREYGPVEKESLLFLVGDADDCQAVFLTGQAPCPLSGYYIFYEKNEVMQNILLEWYRGSSEKKEEPDQDYAVREFRERYGDKQEGMQHRRMMSVMYTASLLLVMLCCITGISMMNQYDKMLRMEESIEHLAMALGERELPETQAVISSAVTNTGRGMTDLETAAPGGTNRESAARQETAARGQADAGTMQPVGDGYSTAAEKDGNQEADPADTTLTAAEAADASLNIEVSDGIVTSDNTAKSDDTAGLPDTAGSDSTDGSREEEGGLAIETVSVQEVVYTVRAGDTLAGISQSYYGTILKVSEICEKNKIEEPDKIHVGQKILLP